MRSALSGQRPQQELIERHEAVGYFLGLCHGDFLAVDLLVDTAEFFEALGGDFTAGRQYVAVRRRNLECLQLMSHTLV